MFIYIDVFAHLHMYTHTRTYVYAQTRTFWGGKESSIHWKSKKLFPTPSSPSRKIIDSMYIAVSVGLCWVLSSVCLCEARLK